MTQAPSSSARRRRTEFNEQRVELAKLFDKLPPHALEAEAALLGSMLQDWRVCGEVVQIIKKPESFYKQAHVVVYELLVELYDKHQSVDVVQLTQRLQDKQLLDDVGGVEYLLELAEAVPSPVHAAHYARIVQDKATLRGLIEATGKILYECYNADEPVGNLLDKAMRDVFEIAQSGQANEASALKDLLQETYDTLAQRAEDGRVITGIETGFFEMDEMLSGLQRGEMIIVAARPSMGKTAFALNIAEHIAATNRQPVAIFSLEMGKQQLAQRLLCSRSGVDSHKLRRNALTGEDFQEIARTIGELAEAPMYIDDTPGLTLLGLRAKARRLASQHDLKAIVIDYLQLMSAPGSESRQQEVSVISRGVKALARELNVAVVCLSQLNRSAEQREGHRPRMSDLRESGSIEQDADVVMMLHREDYYHRSSPDYTPTNTAEVIVAKQRNGPTGTVELTFHGPTTSFHNLAHQSGGGGY